MGHEPERRTVRCDRHPNAVSCDHGGDNGASLDVRNLVAHDSTRCPFLEPSGHPGTIADLRPPPAIARIPACLSSKRSAGRRAATRCASSISVTLPVRLVERDLAHGRGGLRRHRTLAVRGAPAIGICAAMGLVAVMGAGDRLPVDGLPAPALRRRRANPARAAHRGESRVGRRSHARRCGGRRPRRTRPVRAAAVRGNRHPRRRPRHVSPDRRARDRVPARRRRVLTHCNAGALATGGIGTALAPVYLAAERGWRVEVFATRRGRCCRAADSPPGSCRRAGIPVTVLADSAAASLMARRTRGRVSRGRGPDRGQRRRGEQDRHVRTRRRWRSTTGSRSTWPRRPRRSTRRTPTGGASRSKIGPTMRWRSLAGQMCPTTCTACTSGVRRDAGRAGHGDRDRPGRVPPDPFHFRRSRDRGVLRPAHSSMTAVDTRSRDRPGHHRDHLSRDRALTAACVAAGTARSRSTIPRPGWVEHDPDEIFARTRRGRAGGDRAGRRDARGHRHHQPARDGRGLGPRRRGVPAGPRDRVAGPSDVGALRRRWPPRAEISDVAPGW